MILYDELEKLLLKAKESHQYFNPNVLQKLYEIIESHNDQYDDDYAINDWIQNMWSR